MAPSPDHRPARDADPAADADRARVASNIAGQLTQRGVGLTGDESPDELVALLEAVDRFEAARRARGGDSFTNAPDSSDPDDPDLVLPQRQPDEDAESYASRIRAAAARLGARAD